MFSSARSVLYYTHVRPSEALPTRAGVVISVAVEVVGYLIWTLDARWVSVRSRTKGGQETPTRSVGLGSPHSKLNRRAA